MTVSGQQDSATEPPVLAVRGLKTTVAGPDGPRVVVDGLDFDLFAGETVCIAGESGSGKSMTALSLMGLLPEGGRIAGGSARLIDSTDRRGNADRGGSARLIDSTDRRGNADRGGNTYLDGKDLLKLGEAEMRRVRGSQIAMIFQEPMTSLNPLMTVGAQLSEAIAAHLGKRGRAARAEALKMLEAVRIGEPERRLRQYPHELSGGMRQRVMIAMALVCNPKVLIADEPTTALDVTIQAQILALMEDLKSQFGTAILLITHDMGVVAEMADRVIVMNAGKIVESGPVEALFAEPKDVYTRQLLDAVPKLGRMIGSTLPRRAATPTPNAAVPNSAVPNSAVPNSALMPPVVEVRDLTVRFDIRGGLLQRPVQRVHAVEGISFDIAGGETLALVGESGCGKSTTGKALLNLVKWSGAVRVADRDIAGLSNREMAPVRREIQMVFQDPFASLDPRKKVGDLVGEPLLIHGLAKGKDLDARVAELFRRVGLEPDFRQRHPHEFSGGQRQRICIARALSLNPKIIVADESVSALDVSVQAQVLDLLQRLQDDLGLSYLFISHDMSVVEEVSHRVAVMYLGQIVEIGPRAAVFERPKHPYTKALLEAVPIADPTKRRRQLTRQTGEMPSPVRPLDYIPKYVQLNDYGNGHAAAV